MISTYWDWHNGSALCGVSTDEVTHLRLVSDVKGHVPVMANREWCRRPEIQGPTQRSFGLVMTLIATIA